jgi:two-component system CheB/CheR fusion protein
MQNLLNSIEVATVFLDEKLVIKRFTNQAKKVFSLIDGDVGRPIADLAANLRYTGLVEDALDVLATLVYREREIQTSEGQWRQMRIMPYRTHDNLIDGLVLTFVDIDRVKRMELVAQQAREYAEIVVDAVDHALVVLDAELRVLSANRAFYSIFHTTPKQGIGEPFAKLGDGRWDTPEFLDRLRGVLNDPSGHEDFRIRNETARLTPREILLSARAIKTTGGRPMILLRIEDTSATAQPAPA